MSKSKSSVPTYTNRNENTSVRIGSNRAKSVDRPKHRESQRNNQQKFDTEQKTLHDYGYYFDNNGKLVSIENGRPFEFDVYPHKEDNQRRYHAIGKLVDEYIYNLLENDLQLRRISIPIDAKTSEPTGFFFASDDIIQAEYIMIIIHGMGVVRAGQWSRKLIINESINVGSQLDYIARARTNGYGVIVTNTNLNTDESSKSITNSSRPIRGSDSAEEHACYIWRHFVQKCAAPHICIMAHSYGGAVVLALAARYTADFNQRVFAVALTDSPMKSYTTHFSSNVLKMLQNRTINWVADKKPVDTRLGSRAYGEIRASGHTLHEYTSFTAFNAIFRFFEEARQKLMRSTC